MTRLPVRPLGPDLTARCEGSAAKKHQDLNFLYPVEPSQTLQMLRGDTGKLVPGLGRPGR